MSGHRKNPADRGPLTSWRRQTEGLVRTRKVSDRPRPTHQLKIADRGSCQDTERIRPTEAHSLTVDGRQRDLSGHRKDPTDRCLLTSWRRQTGTCQATETIRPIEAHSRTGDGRQRNLLGHRNNPTDRGPLTSWRWQTEGLVRTQNETDQTRPTHILEPANKATCQHTGKNNRARPTHFLETAGRRTGQDTERRKQTERQAWTLTTWKIQGEGQVSI